MKRTDDMSKKLLSLMSVLLVGFFLIFFSLDVWAAEGKVTATSAKIRKEASTSSEAIGSAARGEKYTISNEVTGADGHVWYQITFDGNKSGFIRSDLMEKEGTVTPPATVAPTVSVEELQPISAVITGSSVRVRSDASTQGSIVTGVVKDSVVTITGRAKDNQDKTWYRVTFSSDTGEVTGFIREDFLTPSGEIAPLGEAPVTDVPVVEEPAVDEPVEPVTPVITDDYYLVEEEGKWYLVDKAGGYQYTVESLIKAAEEDPKTFEELNKKIKSQKGWIIILVIAVGGLGVAVTLLFLKVREVMDDAYFAAIEKETIRQRQGQKANNPSTAPKSKNVMHTVGAGGNKPANSGKTSGAKPANVRVAQQNIAGTMPVPQTVKVSNPEDTKAKPIRQANANSNPQVKAAPQAKTMAQGKAVNPENGIPHVRTEVPATEQIKSEVPKAEKAKTEIPKVEKAKAEVKQQAVKPTSATIPEKADKQTWQSKNFVDDDDDDDFEFEFLNWDGSEDD